LGKVPLKPEGTQESHKDTRNINI
jgi:hypothetical protein